MVAFVCPTRTTIGNMFLDMGAILSCPSHEFKSLFNFSSEKIKLKHSEGMPESSRGLSEATPPVGGFNSRTPKGCQKEMINRRERKERKDFFNYFLHSLHSWAHLDDTPLSRWNGLPARDGGQPALRPSHSAVQQGKGSRLVACCQRAGSPFHPTSGCSAVLVASSRCALPWL